MNTPLTPHHLGQPPQAVHTPESSDAAQQVTPQAAQAQPTPKAANDLSGVQAPSGVPISAEAATTPPAAAPLSNLAHAALRLRLTLPDRSTRLRAWLQRARMHAGFRLGSGILLTLLAVALLAQVWTPHDPLAMRMDARLAAASATHWLGTDAYGRDVLSQLMAGAIVSLGVGAVAVGLGMAVGVALGLLAAARRGWVDEAVMRLADFTFAFPAILCAVMLAAVRGPGVVNVMIAIGILNIPVFARVTRGAAVAAWSREFVLAARACGKDAWQITRDHIWGAVLPLLLAQAASQFALAVLAEAALSYLGLGTQPPQPSWGRMLSEAQTLLMQAPLLAVWPGLCIALCVWAINLLGDALRDLADPRTATASAPSTSPLSPAAREAAKTRKHPHAAT